MKQTRPQSLLLVDDDRVLRDRLSRAFVDRGYLVDSADSFVSGQKMISEGTYDYAVIDLQLGDGLGTDFLDQLIQVSPQTRAVMLTGYGTIRTAVDAVRKGAVEYLTKPTNADEILEALQSGERKQPGGFPSPTLAQVEWEHMQRVLEKHDGNVTKAAKALGIHRRSLQRKLSKDPGKLQ